MRLSMGTMTTGTTVTLAVLVALLGVIHCQNATVAINTTNDPTMVTSSTAVISSSATDTVEITTTQLPTSSVLSPISTTVSPLAPSSAPPTAPSSVPPSAPSSVPPSAPSSTPPSAPSSTPPSAPSSVPPLTSSQGAPSTTPSSPPSDNTGSAAPTPSPTAQMTSSGTGGGVTQPETTKGKTTPKSGEFTCTQGTTTKSEELQNITDTCSSDICWLFVNYTTGDKSPKQIMVGCKSYINSKMTCEKDECQYTAESCQCCCKENNCNEDNGLVEECNTKKAAMSSSCSMSLHLIGFLSIVLLGKILI